MISFINEFYSIKMSGRQLNERFDDISNFKSNAIGTN